MTGKKAPEQLSVVEVVILTLSALIPVLIVVLASSWLSGLPVWLIVVSLLGCLAANILLGSIWEKAWSALRRRR